MGEVIRVNSLKKGFLFDKTKDYNPDEDILLQEESSSSEDEDEYSSGGAGAVAASSGMMGGSLSLLNNAASDGKDGKSRYKKPEIPKFFVMKDDIKLAKKQPENFLTEYLWKFYDIRSKEGMSFEEFKKMRAEQEAAKLKLEEEERLEAIREEELKKLD